MALARAEIADARGERTQTNNARLPLGACDGVQGTQSAADELGVTQASVPPEPAEKVVALVIKARVYNFGHMDAT
ncbi:MAG: hypothetical protein ABSB49_17780 [Polyangia bacterium]